MGTMEGTKERRLSHPGHRVSHPVSSTTVNNAVAQPHSDSVLYGPFDPWPLPKLAPVLTWITSKIQNQKGSGSSFKLLRPKNEELVRDNFKLLLLPMVLPRSATFLQALAHYVQRV